MSFYFHQNASKSKKMIQNLHYTQIQQLTPLKK